MMVISFILMTLTIIVFISIAKRTSIKDCISQENFLKTTKYKGIISGKYENANKHYLPTLEIKEGNQKKVFESFRDISGIYDFAQIGDSIIKDSGTLKIEIIRNNKGNNFIIDLNCR